MKKHIWGKNHIYDQLSLYVRRIESEENYQSRTIISKIDIYKANYIGHQVEHSLFLYFVNVY